MFNMGTTAPYAADAPSVAEISLIKSANTISELNIPNLTKSNWKERFWYINIEPEKVAMDHPNMKNTHIEAVALKTASSTIYIGRIKAAKELRIAAAKR